MAIRRMTRENANERPDHFCIAHVTDAVGDAGIHLAGPDGADLPVCLLSSTPGGRRTQAIHRHRKVRDHGHPVLHTCRKFPDSWRRGEAHDLLRDFDGGSSAWRSGPQFGVCLRFVCRRVRLLAGDRGGDRLDPPAGHGQGRLPEEVRRRRHCLIRRTGDPDPAVDRHGDVCRVHQQFDWCAVHGGRDPWLSAGVIPRLHDLVYGQEGQLPT